MDGEAVKLISDAEGVLLGVIEGAVLVLSELLKNQNHSFILKTIAVPRVAFEINWNCNCRDCDHCENHKNKYDCFCIFAPRV